MRDGIEEKTKESQNSFRPSWGTVDVIFLNRKVMERTKEWKIALRLNFINFKAAFDTIWWNTLCNWDGGIGNKTVNISEQLYDETGCAVIINSHERECFEIKVKVRQGCLLFPTLFNNFLEFLMDEFCSIQHTLNLVTGMCSQTRYADDTTLISAIFQKLKISTNDPEASCKKWGMRRNPDRCKIISPEADNIQIDGNKVERFSFLCSVVLGSSSDIRRSIGLTSSVFGQLKKKYALEKISQSK